jgi:hypothetical protein
LKAAPDFTPTSLEEVAGILYRPGRKLSDAEIETRIARQILAEDAATKSR